jgi:hypothetical protein
MEKKIVVPEGMSDAALEAVLAIPMRGNVGSVDRVNGALKAALRWLSENPIVPTNEQYSKLYNELSSKDAWITYNAVIEWQRRMFLAPETECPEAIKDLLDPWIDPGDPQKATGINKRIIQAYIRGCNSKRKGGE